MKRSTFIAAALTITLPALILMSPASAFQQNACMDQGFRSHHATTGTLFRGPIRHRLQMMESLELSQSQREEIWSILDESRPQIRSHMSSLLDGRRQLREILNNGYDKAVVRQLAEAQGKAIADIIVLRTQTRSRVRALLTPDQQVKLSELRANRRNKQFSY